MTIGHTAKGEVVALEGRLATPTVSIGEGERVVADPGNDRFIIISSAADKSYLLGYRVSCVAASPLRLGSQIGCWAAANVRTPAPLVEHFYAPLDESLRTVSDSDLVRSSVVTLTVAAAHGSFACGAQTEAFQRMLARAGRDLGSEATATARVRMVATFQGSRALIDVPAEFASASTARERLELAASTNGDPVTPPGGGSVSCKCNDTSPATPSTAAPLVAVTDKSCPLNSNETTTWCDSSNCKSCTMIY